MQETDRWYGRSDDFTRYVTYEDSEAIQTISEKLYPRDWIQESWHMDAKRAESYAVTVYFKQGTEAMGAYGGVAEYCFTKDEVPDFIKEATAYEKQ